MARKTLQLDTSGLEGLISELAELEGNVEQAVERALRVAALQVQNDTVIAVHKSNLPAGGEYSSGDTARSIIHFPQVEWEGTTAWVPVGFDFFKPGAGGFLISGRRGTPRMAPDAKLRKIYKSKSYMNNIQAMMQDEIMKELSNLWSKKS